MRKSAKIKQLIRGSIKTPEVGMRVGFILRTKSGIVSGEMQVAEINNGVITGPMTSFGADADNLDWKEVTIQCMGANPVGRIENETFTIEIPD